jgi:hypothetical protein
MNVVINFLVVLNDMKTFIAFSYFEHVFVYNQCTSELGAQREKKWKKYQKEKKF